MTDPDPTASGVMDGGSGPIDRDTRDAIHRFVRVLAQRGCPTRAIQEEVALACEGLTDVQAGEPAPWRRVDDSAHVLTLWFSDPAYTDREGEPSPLQTLGPAPSLEALVSRVDPALDVTQVLEVLRRTGSVRQVGERYAPRKRSLVMRDARDLPDVLGGLFGHLQTFEHNGWGPRDDPRLETYSLNRNIPLSAVADLEGKMRTMGERFILQTDATLHDAEAERRPGERTVHMGIGVYEWIYDPLAPGLAGPAKTSKEPGSR